MNPITKNNRADFLFANSNFIIGAGSVFNIAGNYFSFNSSESPEIADLKAIESDWGVVGEEIERANNDLEKEYNNGTLISNER